ncbi:MAG: glycosyltransferase family 4 protein [Anaerolineae bacterium]|nr:glycosyltransferase family 4 protein [Anaerolineae bacterium]
MRIFVATGIFHPEPGGPATYLYRFLPELIERGHEVRVLTFSDDEVSDANYPYPVRRIVRRGVSAPMRYFRYARAAAPLEAWSDLVFVHDLTITFPYMRPRVYKVVGDIAWERAINKGWIDPHTDIDTFQTMRHNPFVMWLRWFRAQKVRRAACVIVPSKYLADMVTGWGALRERVKVIYNALGAMPILPDLAAARVQLGLPPGEKLFFTAARLAPWKGIDYLIEAMTGVEGAHLLIAGDGPELERLRALAEALRARVTFLGRISRDQVALYMRAADYFVLYSGYEGLPHVLLESLKVGTPVIASSKGGIPEVIRHDVNGLLVRWADIPALARTLRRAIEEPGLRARLAHSNGSAALGDTVDFERFAWPKLVDETITTLEEAAAQK